MAVLPDGAQTPDGNTAGDTPTPGGAPMGMPGEPGAPTGMVGDGDGDAMAAPESDAGSGMGPSLSDAGGAPGDEPTAARGTGPGDWEAGDYPPGLAEENYLEISGVPGQMGPRQYKVHVPPGYDPQVPMPAVFCIHGLGQTPVLFCVNGAGWPAAADEHGFILIMPNGFQNSWNGGTCCGGASANQLDDVALFRAILDEVGSHVNIDLDRVYASGLSNGGYMSYRLACEAADIFAAIAPGAGAVGINTIGGGTNPASDFTACEPSRPISVLDIHGTADALVPFALQQPSLTRMAESAGCDPSPTPADQPASSGDTECVSYAGCDDGIEITGCTVEGGGHCWFGSEDCGTGAGPIGAAIVGANSDTMDNNAAIVEFFGLD